MHSFIMVIMAQVVACRSDEVNVNHNVTRVYDSPQENVLCIALDIGADVKRKLLVLITYAHTQLHHGRGHGAQVVACGSDEVNVNHNVYQGVCDSPHEELFFCCMA